MGSGKGSNKTKSTFKLPPEFVKAYSESLGMARQAAQGGQRLVVALVHHQITLTEIAHLALHVSEARDDLLRIGVAFHVTTPARERNDSRAIYALFPPEGQDISGCIRVLT